MSDVWLYGLVGVFVLGSILHDLFRGEVCLRGYATYYRQEDAGKYWLAISLKVFVLTAVMIAGFLHMQ